MADLAMTFHWHPDEMDDLHPSELLRWHKLAVERLKAQGGQNGR